MKQTQGTFKFTVPADSPREAERGTKLTPTFTWTECETAEDIEALCKERETTVLAVVNQWSKDRSKSNAYQSLLASHKPADLSADEAFEAIVRTLIRSGLSEEKARARAKKMQEDAE